MKKRLVTSRKAARALLACLLLGLLAWYILPFAFPLPPELLESPAASPVYLDRHGKTLLRLTLPDSSRASAFSLEAVPTDLVACTLAAEDKRFWKHGGVDLLAVARAARDSLNEKRITSGASTITQQLIKISSPARPRTSLTKLREALTARHLEMRWTKQEILTAYLNRLDYGNLNSGTAEAARFYFQKPLTDLSLAECALLAGLPQAPSRLNPMRHPQRAITRRDTVLHRLASLPGADPARISSALRETPTLRPLLLRRPAPWLAQSRFGKPSVINGKIHTTLDLELQNAVQNIVHQETEKLKSTNLRHAAVVIIHNPTGEILALVSSASWADERGGQINGALAPRSPGSALKPFTYLLAISQNHRLPSSILADIPTPFRTPQGLDLPANYDRTYRGPVTLRTALACSLNLPALRELNALGGPQPLHAFLQRLGITTLDKDPVPYGIGLTLGNAPVNLLELTQAYATLARTGLSIPPVLFQNTPPASQATQIFPTRDAYLIADVLSDPQARAPAFPPGGPLDLPFRCAVKTGTSSDFRDNWCLGFTPDFTVGVWAGNFENQPMQGISGVAGAGPIFHQTMLKLHRSQKPAWFNRPPDLVEISIDSRIGKSAPSTLSPTYLRHDLAPRDQLPAPAIPTDYDPSGKALLNHTFTEWFRSRHNLRRQDFALDTRPATTEPLRIITPANDVTLLLDPEIPSGSDKLRPVTNLPGLGIWKSETLRIEPSTPEPIIHLAPGTHQVTVTDPRTQVSQTFTLHIKPL